MILRAAFAAILALGMLAEAPAADAPLAERTYRLGWLSPTIGPRQTFLDALRELGWIEGRNIVFEVRTADGQRERLQDMATDLVRANVDLIVAVAPAAILAAQQATTKIPIVMAFWGGTDLVESGVVASLARPGGNVTGVHMQLQALDAKRLDLLHQAMPKAKKIAVLIHDRKAFELQLAPVREVARQAGLDLLIVNTQEGDRGYEGAFEAIVRGGAEALLVMGSPDFARDRAQIVELAARRRIPTVSSSALFARQGGLMAYGTTEVELDRQAARYVASILKGVKPGDLAIEQPTKFELVINMRTARTLGLLLPQSIVLRADQVIE